MCLFFLVHHFTSWQKTSATSLIKSLQFVSTSRRIMLSTLTSTINEPAHVKIDTTVIVTILPATVQYLFVVV